MTPAQPATQGAAYEMNCAVFGDSQKSVAEGQYREEICNEIKTLLQYLNVFFFVLRCNFLVVGDCSTCYKCGELTDVIGRKTG